MFKCLSSLFNCETLILKPSTTFRNNKSSDSIAIAVVSPAATSIPRGRTRARIATGVPSSVRRASTTAATTVRSASAVRPTVRSAVRATSSPRRSRATSRRFAASRVRSRSRRASLARASSLSPSVSSSRRRRRHFAHLTRRRRWRRRHLTHHSRHRFSQPSPRNLLVHDPKLAFEPLDVSPRVFAPSSILLRPLPLSSLRPLPHLLLLLFPFLLLLRPLLRFSPFLFPFPLFLLPRLSLFLLEPSLQISIKRVPLSRIRLPPIHPKRPRELIHLRLLPRLSRVRLHRRRRAFHRRFRASLFIQFPFQLASQRIRLHPSVLFAHRRVLFQSLREFRDAHFNLPFRVVR